MDSAMDRKPKVDGRRQRDKVSVPCHIQQLAYSTSFRQIDNQKRIKDLNRFR